MENIPENDTDIPSYANDNNFIPIAMPPENKPKSRKNIANKITCLVVIIILLAVASCGSYYYGNKDVASLNSQINVLNSKVSDNSSTASSTTSSSKIYGNISVDPTNSDWNTYTNQDLNISFKYPKSWLLETSVIYPDTITISVASQWVELSYGNNVQGLGGTCSGTGPSVQVTGVTKLDTMKTNSKSPVYLVENDNTDVGLVTPSPANSNTVPKVGDNLNCFYNATISTPDSSRKSGYALSYFGTRLMWTPSNSNSETNNDTQKALLAEYFTTAKTILSSFTYIKQN